MATDIYAKSSVKELEQHEQQLEESFNRLLRTYQDQADVINSIIVKLAAYPANIRTELNNIDQGTRMGDGQMIKTALDHIGQALDAIITAVNNYEEYVSEPLRETLDTIQTLDNAILALKQPQTPLQPALQKLFADVQTINQDILAVKAQEQQQLKPTNTKNYRTLITTIISEAGALKRKLGKSPKELRAECEQLIFNAETLRKSIPFTDHYIQTTLAKQIYLVTIELKRLLEL